MADKVDISFPMTPEDLTFLIWAMDFLKSGPHDEEDLIG